MCHSLARTHTHKKGGGCLVKEYINAFRKKILGWKLFFFWVILWFENRSVILVKGMH